MLNIVKWGGVFFIMTIFASANLKSLYVEF